MKTSEKLQIIQKLSRLTQTKLAEELKVSFPTLNSWINERSQPHKRKTKRIDELYEKYSGIKTIPEDNLTAKKEIILKKSKKYKNIISHIKNRPDLFEQFTLSLTYNTNSIEGSTLTENETAAILFQNITFKNKDLIEHLEAKNHQSALKYLFEKISNNHKITEEFILELHHILMNSIRPDAGMYRRQGVRIVGANVPTVNYIKIPSLMEQLVKEINRNPKNSISHISKIHSKFEQIHPFSDGNGRIGRLILVAMLLKENIAPAVIKKEKKHLYYKCLQKSQQKEEFEELENFICDSVLNGFGIMEAE